jgi:tRNA U38,U39,U40 pseudouridine synthase TruA
MNTDDYCRLDSTNAQFNLTEKSYRFSFSSFQKAIKSNSELRKQIEDIVDFGLFDYALRRNTTFIQSVREKAEAETMELMMRFTNGVDDYQKLKKMIHRNRIIRTLAIMDRNAQLELMNRFNRFMSIAN